MRTFPVAVTVIGPLLLAGCIGSPAGRELAATGHPTGAPAETHVSTSASSAGLASYYHAAGLTAAHRTLPLGTRVRVTNISNGRSVIVRINDRGPFIRGRSIDLSNGAAEAVGMTRAGVAQVRMEVIK